MHEHISLVNAHDSRNRSQGRGRGYSSGPKPPRQSNFCGRSDHTVDYCYAKHGHPNFQKQAPFVNASSSSVTNEAPSGSYTDASPPSANISQEKYDYLVSLLQKVNLLPSSSTPSASANQINSPSMSGISSILSCSISSKSDIWLLDSGANEHVTSSAHWFTSYHKINPKPVNLPNGTSVLVQYVGTIYFSPHFHLENVLYSPLFTMNLISICESLNCHAIFHNKMIGLGDQIEGLYRLVLDSFNKPLCNSLSVNNISSNTNLTIPSTTLWHFRLGHVSHKRLTHMSQLYPSLTFDDNATCDICHFAKQKKLPFTSSLFVASRKFEFLHIDIWGPLSTTSVHNHM